LDNPSTSKSTYNSNNTSFHHQHLSNNKTNKIACGRPHGDLEVIIDKLNNKTYSIEIDSDEYKKARK